MVSNSLKRSHILKEQPNHLGNLLVIAPAFTSVQGASLKLSATALMMLLETVDIVGKNLNIWLPRKSSIFRTHVWESATV